MNSPSSTAAPTAAQSSSASMTDAIARSLRNAAAALQSLTSDSTTIATLDRIAATIADRVHPSQPTRGKVLVCGNGGSMCDAMHFAEELTGRFRKDRPALPAIACADPSHLTCAANDFGFDHVFARWVEALGNPGDCLIVLSTSGNSPNILNAIEAARARGLTTIALLGKDGGKVLTTAGTRCDHTVIVPGETSDRIQELHMLLLHILVEAIEIRLFGKS